MEDAMQEKFPGAVSLGYAALFIFVWLMFMPFAGWYSFDSFTAVLPFVMILGVTLAIAGVFCFFNESKVESVLFLILGTAGFAFMLRGVIFPGLEANTAYSPIDGWIMVLIAVVIFYLWLGSMKGNSVKQFFLLLLWLAFLAAALANWFSVDVLAYIGGYLGLISALLAGWYSASTVLPGKTSTPESST
jgi:succinate-acetate transporter protein